MLTGAVIPPKGHAFENYTVTLNPTCTTAGREEGVCAHDPAHKDTRVIPVDPSAHAWGAWTETRAATTLADGGETRTCAHDSAHKETRDIPGSRISEADFYGVYQTESAFWGDYTYTITINADRIIFTGTEGGYIEYTVSGWTAAANTATDIPDEFSTLTSPKDQYPSGYIITSNLVEDNYMWWNHSGLGRHFMPSGSLIALSPDKQTLYVGVSASRYERGGAPPPNIDDFAMLINDSLFTRE